MEASEPRQDPGAIAPAIVVVAFGTVVAMWAVGYVARLPAVSLPSPALLILMLACLAGGGVALGRQAGGGWARGVLLGLVAGLLNLMILGSFLTSGTTSGLRPSVWWWIPGSFLVSAALAAAGTMAGARWWRTAVPRRRWTAPLARIAVLATLLLLAVGGLVTSAEAGLAVHDWPTSFGYNMFLYPFSRMTGGIYYEHAHRLFGALVGLTTVVLAVFVQVADRRPGVRLLGWLAVVLVVLQGLLGGLRVTERSLALAMAHGVLAQLFFATLVALAAMTSELWTGPSAPRPSRTARADRLLSGGLAATIVVQLVLGATQRHYAGLLLAHVGFGLAIVAPLALHAGMRSWGVNDGVRPLQRLGLVLVGATVLQVLLGVGAFVATRLPRDVPVARVLDLTLATAHQWFGAVLLATAILMVCFNFRLLTTRAG